VFTSCVAAVLSAVSLPLQLMEPVLSSTMTSSMLRWRRVTSVVAPTSSLVIEISRRKVVSTDPVAEIVTLSSSAATEIAADCPGALLASKKAWAWAVISDSSRLVDDPTARAAASMASLIVCRAARPRA